MRENGMSVTGNYTVDVTMFNSGIMLHNDSRASETSLMKQNQSFSIWLTCVIISFSKFLCIFKDY